MRRDYLWYWHSEWCQIKLNLKYEREHLIYCNYHEMLTSCKYEKWNCVSIENKLIVSVPFSNTFLLNCVVEHLKDSRMMFTKISIVNKTNINWHFLEMRRNFCIECGTMRQCTLFHHLKNDNILLLLCRYYFLGLLLLKCFRIIFFVHHSKELLSCSFLLNTQTNIRNGI